jgi:MOSC domain-containing protein YiiM
MAQSEPRGVLTAIHVGKPRRMGVRRSDDPAERPWYSGIYKEPVAGPIWLGESNLDGDGQADNRVHGGPNRAALCYAAAHYAQWAVELPDVEWQPDMFGENFTIDGLEEATVCMGDIYRVGAARIQVSQLRGPCFKLERRIGRDDMIERVLRTVRSGWYVRVLTQGMVEEGQEVILESREEGAPTILAVHAAKHWKA